MATQPQTLYTYADLERFPEDNLRREIIDSELIVTPSPVTRHQDAVMTLGGELYQYVKAHGGNVDKVDIWGRRRLAYEIQKKTEGIYAVVDFTASADTAKELDRQLGLNEVVLRTKVLRANV